MPKSQNDIANARPFPDVGKEAATDEDEINLIDYLRALWKRKYFILLGSVLPALIVGLIFYFGPRNYKVTYVYDVRGWSIYDVRDRSIYDVRGRGIYNVRDQSIYDVRDQSIYDVRDQSVYDVRDQSIYDVSNWSLNEKNYRMFLDKFFSKENIDKIVNRLRENGLHRYAEEMTKASTTEDLKNFVDFEVSPPYTDLSKTKITNPVELEQIRQLIAQLLNMTVVGRPKNDIPKISLVIRDNLENVISVYMVEEQLTAAARRLRASIADIEENSFELQLALKTDKAVLANLKNIKTPVSDGGASNIALQFDISGKTEYLPVEYQIQATESKITQVEGEFAASEERYDYYKNLLALNEKLLAELKNKMSSYYTIQQFHSFLTAVVNSYESKDLKSYLNSYIKRIENRISASAPVTEKPNAWAVSKGTAKKIAIVFAIALMLSMFAAFLLEGLKKSQAQAS